MLPLLYSPTVAICTCTIASKGTYCTAQYKGTIRTMVQYCKYFLYKYNGGFRDKSARHKRNHTVQIVVIKNRNLTQNLNWIILKAFAMIAAGEDVSSTI